jgi:hypothetical protein
VVTMWSYFTASCSPCVSLAKTLSVERQGRKVKLCNNLLHNSGDGDGANTVGRIDV